VVTAGAGADTPPAGRRAALVGVDLLDLLRAPAQPALARAVLTEDEARACRRWAHGVHAYLAVKEAIVKAVGGRPPGFRWQSAVVGRPLPRTLCPTPLLQLVDAADGNVISPVFVRCRLGGGLPAWARARLAVADDVDLRCTGAWTATRPDELLAVVVVEPIGPIHEPVFDLHHGAVF
jgi:hypothetical protein